MRNLNENNITEVVNARLSETTTPRLKQIISSLTSHLHDFVRDVELTEEEWLEGIKFLTATGQKCNDKRQEFILLSDVLGVSMLCVALNNRKPAHATEATVFGPFHVPDSPLVENGSDISNGAEGYPCIVRGSICSLDGKPIRNAMMDIWHADGAGWYDVQTGDPETRCRGRLKTDEKGQFYFRTVKPVPYQIPSDGPVGKLLSATGRHPWRPAHIHFMIQADGYETLITHVFENGDPYLESDAVFGVRSSLVGDYILHETDAEINGTALKAPFYTLDFDFILNRK